MTSGPSIHEQSYEHPCSLVMTFSVNLEIFKGNGYIFKAGNCQSHLPPFLNLSISVPITSISFFKKLAGRLASATACTLMPQKMAYVSRCIELI